MNYSIKYFLLQATMALATNLAHGATDIGECRDITKPGAYVLSRNLVVTSGVPCIRMLSSRVNLDLGGHVIQGPGRDVANSAAVVANRELVSSISVTNGNIQDFETGVSLGSHSVVSNTKFLLTSKAIRIKDGHVSSNSIDAPLTGIEVDGRSIIEHNTVVAAGGFAIIAAPDLANVIRENLVIRGQAGIRASSLSLVRSNSIQSTVSNGLEVSCPSSVIGNMLPDNNIKLVGNALECFVSANVRE